MKSVPTSYRGIEYRSRLEARWAAFFDRIGWQHTYEPFDGDGYIPDFVIHGDQPLLIEIKPAVTAPEYQAPVAKVTAGLSKHWCHDVLILGADPLPGLDNSAFGWHYPPAGLLGEWVNWQPSDFPGAVPGWDFGVGNWFTCQMCKKINVFHSSDTFNGRPCGHHDAASYIGHINPRIIRGYWAQATNFVKWHGRTR